MKATVLVESSSIFSPGSLCYAYRHESSRYLTPFYKIEGNKTKWKDHVDRMVENIKLSADWVNTYSLKAEDDLKSGRNWHLNW